MKLWGGRFTKETDQLVHAFNESLSFDQRFYRQDIRGSIAHVTMLAEQQIVSREDGEKIIEGLEQILADIEEGSLSIGPGAEDIHSFVEEELTKRIGEAGKRLHTGRSRNDQVALDMKLYTRDQVKEMDHLLYGLLEELLKIMEENLDTYMPGFTHMQKAQPITLAHHVGAYFEMFSRDRSRLRDLYERMNYCPLGAGALAGTTSGPGADGQPAGFLWAHLKFHGFRVGQGLPAGAFERHVHHLHASEPVLRGGDRLEHR